MHVHHDVKILRLGRKLERESVRRHRNKGQTNVSNSANEFYSVHRFYSPLPSSPQRTPIRFSLSSTTTKIFYTPKSSPLYTVGTFWTKHKRQQAPKTESRAARFCNVLLKKKTKKLYRQDNSNKTRTHEQKKLAAARGCRSWFIPGLQVAIYHWHAKLRQLSSCHLLRHE